VRVPSRRSHEAEVGTLFITGDLATGEGIKPAMDGVETIVHLAGSAKGDEDKTRNLVRAASSQRRLPHLVYISVVGAKRIPIHSRVDRAMFGYFASKLAAEKVVEDSRLPWTTLRATQFYDLILIVAKQMVKLPVIPLPAGFRFQWSTPERWRPASSSSRSESRRSWCPTWVGRECTARPSCSAATLGLPSGSG
jgi:uncharacterized protein YbjT (DUF2867 family)